MWRTGQGTTMIKIAIPLLHVSDSARARDFYCNQLGFKLEFVHRPEHAKHDPCYMGLSRDRAWLHLSSFSDDGVAGGVAGFVVDDVDALYAEFMSKGVTISVGPVDQTWGNREMYVRDADNNSLRFLRPQAG